MEDRKITDSIEKFPIQRVASAAKQVADDMVAREIPLTIIFNNQELVTLLCSPTDKKYLAIGFLFSEGLIKSKEEIRKITVDDRGCVVRVESEGDTEHDGKLFFSRLITSGGGRGITLYGEDDVRRQVKIESQLVLSTTRIFALTKEFQRCSRLHKTTGGTHSAALCDTKSILVFSEDIGRHNAVDKIFGECLLRDIPTGDRIVITAGRVPSEILLKVARRKIPILISKAAPTNVGVKLANDLGITLIGFVRGERMNIYSGAWRIVTDGA